MNAERHETCSVETTDAAEATALRLAREGWSLRLVLEAVGLRPESFPVGAVALCFIHAVREKVLLIARPREAVRELVHEFRTGGLGACLVVWEVFETGIGPALLVAVGRPGWAVALQFTHLEVIIIAIWIVRRCRQIRRRPLRASAA